MRFDWTDLQVFLHVCDAGTMTRAAERCHLTLAAVSARVRALEEANDLVLLHRHARGVAPTEAGEVLASHARLVFEQVQRLERDLLQAQGAAPRPAVLLANSSALARPLADAIADVQDHDASRPIVVRESASEATVQALRSAAADAGLVSDAVDTRGLVTRELGSDPLVLVVPRAHPLAATSSVTFREVLAHPWVRYAEHSALSLHLQLRAMALGAPIRTMAAYPTVAGVLRLVGCGLGVSVLPRALVDAGAIPVRPELVEGPAPASTGSARTAWGDITCITLDEPWAQRRLLVCHAQGNDPWRLRLADALVRHWPATAATR
ncbi:MAG TPA: LysR family transcriptional regulator [Ramlibacter sp.]